MEDDYIELDRYLYYDNNIGEGTFSKVYKGFDTENDNIDVAIKKISTKNLNDKILSHIYSEINIMKNINHINIIKFISAIKDDSNIYIVMEYCEIGDLSNFIKGKILTEYFTKKLMIQLKSALQYLLNKNIIHRDLKPQNILLDKNMKIKLTDFGFAKYFSSKSQDLSNTICGSPIYMAPEVIKCEQYTIQSDLWSIGIILYEMLVGRIPFKANTHYELINIIDNNPITIPQNIELSINCIDIIKSLLQKNVNLRINWDDFFNHKWFNKDRIYTINSSPINSSPINLYDFIENYDDNKIKKRNSIDNNDLPYVQIDPDDNIYYNNINKIDEDNNKILIENINDDNYIYNKRKISSNMLSYMNNALNYFKTYYE